MMRFRLRTLLILLAVGPPFIASVVQYRIDQYRNWHALENMRLLERATWKRDELLETWRKTYDLLASGVASTSQEAAIRQQYYAAWRDVEKAKGVIKSQYGSMDAARQRAAKAEKAER